MPLQEKFDILSFRSRQHAFHFSKILRDHGIASQIMSTPKEILLGCGAVPAIFPYMTDRG